MTTSGKPSRSMDEPPEPGRAPVPTPTTPPASIPDPWGVKRAENLIAGLTGVLSARIVVTPLGEIAEIHVLTTNDVPAKQEVRNVESALMAQLGMKVDHRKVSVAQTADVQPIEAIQQEIRQVADHPLHPGGPRLRIVGIKMFLDGGMLTGSAYMLKPWGRNENYGIRDDTYRGVLNIPPDQLVEMVRHVAQHGMQFTAHAQGDGATTTLLAATREGTWLDRGVMALVLVGRNPLVGPSSDVARTESLREGVEGSAVAVPGGASSLKSKERYRLVPVSQAAAASSVPSWMVPSRAASVSRKRGRKSLAASRPLFSFSGKSVSGTVLLQRI